MDATLYSFENSVNFLRLDQAPWIRPGLQFYNIYIYIVLKNKIYLPYNNNILVILYNTYLLRVYFDLEPLIRRGRKTRVFEFS